MLWGSAYISYKQSYALKNLTHKYVLEAVISKRYMLEPRRSRVYSLPFLRCEPSLCHCGNLNPDMALESQDATRDRGQGTWAAQRRLLNEGGSRGVSSVSSGDLG